MKKNNNSAFGLKDVAIHKLCQRLSQTSLHVPRFIALLALLLLFPAVGVQATDPDSPDGEKDAIIIPDGARGKDLAQRLCVNCHLVSTDSNGTASDRVPSFYEIANRPKQTAQGIRQAILKPHYNMPEIALTTNEINDIIAYLDELRTDEAGPDLLPRNEEPPELEFTEPS